MDNWISHFRLTADPFSETGDAWQYYYGARYGVASLRLERAFEQRKGHVLITGPAGTGKTSLLRTALPRAPIYAKAAVSVSQRPPIAVIENLLRSREPMEGLFSDTRRRAALLEMIERAKAQDKSIVCIIEDAHLARPGQLKELVSALSTTQDAESVIQLVLVGRPLLAKTIESRSLAALRARIAHRVETTTLSSDEVSDYLTDRLEAAGAVSPIEIIPPSSMRAIAQHSGGVMALCETIARKALARAAEIDANAVTSEIVDEVAAIYATPDQMAAGNAPFRSMPSFLTSGSAAGLIVLALVFAAAQVRLVGGQNGTRQAGVETTATDRTRTERPTLAAPAVARAEEPSSSRSVVTPTAGSDSKNVATGEPNERKFETVPASSPLRKNFLEGSPYEVQISPPPRPIAADSAKPTLSTGTRGTAASARPSTGTKVVVPTIQVRKPAPNTQIASAKKPTPRAPVVAQPATRAISPGYALQVGAFRELRSANDLKVKLKRQFTGVYISTTVSGGEPLYRVRVGNFKNQSETNALKDRIQAAGYASFRVKEDQPQFAAAD